MKYKFNVNMNDKDYLDYNMFWMLRSPYGKKQVANLRIVFFLLIGILVLITLVGGGFSLQSLVDALPLLIFLAIYQLLLVPCYKWGLKGHIKSLSKKGKPGYTPSSVIEFYEDAFVETTDKSRNETKYSAVERISVVDDKVVYIHVNNIMAYILPFECYESAQQRNEFLEFIKSKCGNVDIYQ